MNIGRDVLTESNHGVYADGRHSARLFDCSDSWPEEPLFPASNNNLSLNKMYLAPSRASITKYSGPTKQSNVTELKKPKVEEDEISLASEADPSLDQAGLLTNETVQTNGFDLRPLTVESHETTESSEKQEDSVSNEEIDGRVPIFGESNEEVHEHENESRGEEHDDDIHDQDSSYDASSQGLARELEITERTSESQDEAETESLTDSTSGNEADFIYDLSYNDNCFSTEDGVSGGYLEEAHDGITNESTSSYSSPEYKRPKPSGSWNPTSFWSQLDTNFEVPALDDDERVGLCCSTDHNDIGSTPVEQQEAESLIDLPDYTGEDESDNMEAIDDMLNSVRQEIMNNAVVDIADDTNSSFTGTSAADSLLISKCKAVRSDDDTSYGGQSDERSMDTFSRSYCVQMDRQGGVVNRRLSEKQPDWTCVTLSPIRETTEKKFVGWERPEWTKDRALRTVESSTTPKNSIGWEKPSWAKASILKKTDKGLALRSGKEIIPPRIPKKVNESIKE